MIPKIIHLCWNDKNLLNLQHPLIINGVGNLKILNPEWRIDIHDDKDIDNYLKDVLQKEDYDLVQPLAIVPKTDLWRLFKLYFEGGLYVDIDRMCNISLSEIIDSNIKWVLPICNLNDFSHDIMCSEPFNPIFKITIELYLERKKQGHTSTFFLGPQTYMHGITIGLFNKMINTGPGEDEFKNMINIIQTIPFIKYYIETPPHNTILYRGSILYEEWEQLKRSFYKENGIKHWTGEW